MQDRFERLQFKLNYLNESTKQMLGLIQAHRSFLLEVAVVVLFVIDVAFVIIEFLKAI